MIMHVVLRGGNSSRWAVAASAAGGSTRPSSARPSITRQYHRQTPAAFLSTPSSASISRCKNSHSHHHRLRCSTPDSALFSTHLGDNNYNHGDLLTSTSSTTVKRFIGLSKKAKKRRDAGETVVEGPRMVLDLLTNPTTRPWVHQILVSTDLEGDETASIRDELDRVLRAAKDDNDNHPLSIHMATPQVVKACSDTVTPQGILARVQIPPWNLDEVLQVSQHQPQQPNQTPLYLVLDGVSDPGNLGTLLRSSVAVGVTAVLLLPGSCDVWNPKAVRSAMGGSFLVPTFSLASWGEALELLHTQCNCHSIWAATMLQDNQGRVVSSAHYDIDWNQHPQALVIGSEGTGLSPSVRQSLATAGDDDNDDSRGGVVRAVHVPMQGTIESLNAAVCGSVIMFEYMRQWKQHENS